MKRMNIKHGLLLLVVFLYGCLPSLSLQPLYTDDTIVFDEAILGKWYGKNGGSWSFTKDGDSQYSLRRVAGFEEAQFEVHLVQVGNHRFIDLYPGDNMDLEDIAGVYHENLVPAHTFMKLDLSEPNLLLQWVNFEDAIKEAPDLLKHEKHSDGDSILITAAPEDIQRVLIENLDAVLVEDGFAMQKCPVDFSQVDTIFDMRILGQWESDDGKVLDIIALDNGYDILFSDAEIQQTFQGVLYNLNDQSVLGLYCIANASKGSQSEMDLPPDILVQIECNEHQLKTQSIEWDQLESFMNDNSAYSFDNSEPEDVFQRITEK